MQPVPIPDGVAEANGGHRVVFSAPDGDLISDEIRACEAMVTDDSITILIELDDADRVSAMNGLPIWLSILGRHLSPFSIEFAQPVDPARVIDWRDMFRRYADLVGEEEGVDFLNRGDWSPAEQESIEALMRGQVRWPGQPIRSADD